VIAALDRVLSYGVALLALAGFVAALSVHLASYAGMNLVTAPAFQWGLHGGIFVVMAPLVLVLAIDSLRRRPGAGFGRAGTLVFLALLAYALVNFYLCFRELDARGAVSREGRPATAELAADDPLNARIFSGHWLLFYFLPLAYFTRRARARS
jgi:hypothetical protein